MLDFSDAPPEILDLRGWLLANEFVEGGGRSEGRNNQYSVFTSGRKQVLLGVDRGAWEFTLRLLEMNESFDAGTWEAWFDGRDLALEREGLNEQVAFTIGRWPLAADQAMPNPAVAEQHLREVGERWVQRRYGWTKGV
jgi:hypothetical protein